VDGPAWLMMPVLLLACYAIAGLSWNLFEKRFLMLKRFFDSKPRSLDGSRPRGAVVA
jgi:hypothetical protein